MDNRVCMFYVADRLDDIINGEDPKKFRDECIYNLGVNARRPAVDPKPSKGVALREWLRDSGLSALEFSRRLDVSQPTLSRWMLMGDQDLTKFQAAQLRWLKRQVDALQEERYRSDARPNVQRELFAAREELDTYVSNLREIGKQI